MTGEELYEISAKGYKHDPYTKLPKLVQRFYEEYASRRRGNNYQEQGESLYQGESTCCGGCSGPNNQCC